MKYKDTSAAGKLRTEKTAERFKAFMEDFKAVLVKHKAAIAVDMYSTCWDSYEVQFEVDFDPISTETSYEYFDTVEMDHYIHWKD